MDHIVTIQRVAINNHGKSLWHCSECCNPSNGGKVPGKRHCPEGSEIWITAQTNVSLEHRLFELMKDEKYRIIHISHVGSILQITSIRINVFKVCLHINSNTRPLTTSSNLVVHHQNSSIFQGNSYKPLLRGRQLLDFGAAGSFQMFYTIVRRLFLYSP
jgi:hypothetical protein